MADGVVVVGSGGHAKVVIAALHATGHPVSVVLDDDPARWGSTVLGVPVQGPVALLGKMVNPEAVIAVGNNRARQQIADAYSNVDWKTVVHPFSWVHNSVVLGPGTVVFAGAVIQPDTKLGAHVIVNTGASVDHDCIVGDCAHLAPGVRLTGGVTVGEGSLLGVGSVVKPYTRIGAWATVGAGAAVVADLPGGITVVGVPARPLAKKA